MVVELDIKSVSYWHQFRKQDLFLKNAHPGFFFCFNNYLDLYVFFYVKNICSLRFIPVLIIVYVLFLPFAFSEIGLDQRYAQRSSIT